MPAKAPPQLDNYASDEVVEQLNAMTIGELIAVLGSPVEHVTYSKLPGWKPGDERPALADDDPAVQQAIGRCAANKSRLTGTARTLFGDFHPSECGWCGYPLEELLKVCSWAVHQSGYIQSHVFEWKDKEKRTYVRAGGDTGYRNKAHRAFWDLPPKERERRIQAARGSEQVNALIKESTDGK